MRHFANVNVFPSSRAHDASEGETLSCAASPGARPAYLAGRWLLNSKTGSLHLFFCPLFSLPSFNFNIHKSLSLQRPTHFAAPCAAAILSPSPPHPRSRVGGLSSGSEALVARSQQPVYHPSNHEGVSVHPRRPGRGTDWKLLLGTLLPRTWHRSRWWVHV